MGIKQGLAHSQPGHPECPSRAAAAAETKSSLRRHRLNAKPSLNAFLAQGLDCQSALVLLARGCTNIVDKSPHQGSMLGYVGQTSSSTELQLLSAAVLLEPCASSKPAPQDRGRPMAWR